MTQKLYILKRKYIRADVSWDATQLTAAQDEGEVLADIHVKAFNPELRNAVKLITFVDNDIYFGFSIDNSLYDVIRTKCLLGLEYNLIVVMQYAKIHSA
jgi:hypothetical protein